VEIFGDRCNYALINGIIFCVIASTSLRALPSSTGDNDDSGDASFEHEKRDKSEHGNEFIIF
jgi:hypothetical protein